MLGRILVCGRRTLQDFEVLYVGVFGVDVEFDFSHWDIHCHRSSANASYQEVIKLTVYAVKYLTQCCPVHECVSLPHFK